MGRVPLPTRTRASKIGRLPSPRFEQGRLRSRQRHRQGLRPRKAARRACPARHFGETSARSPQLHDFALSEPAASDGEQSVLGPSFRPTADKRDAGKGVAGSRRQIEVDSRTPRTAGAPLPARRTASKIGKLLSPQVSNTGGSDFVRRHQQGLCPQKQRRPCSARYFGESSARSPQLHGVKRSPDT